MDCNITTNYSKEKARMLKINENGICTIYCVNCPFSRKNNGADVDCKEFEIFHIEKAIAQVQKWSDEHPQKSYLDDFLEKFPNASLHAQCYPQVCRKKLYGGECIGVCAVCWRESLLD